MEGKEQRKIPDFRWASECFGTWQYMCESSFFGQYLCESSDLVIKR